MGFGKNAKEEEEEEEEEDEKKSNYRDSAVKINAGETENQSGKKNCGYIWYIIPIF